MQNKKVVHFTSVFGSSSSRIIKEARTYCDMGYDIYIFSLRISNLDSNVDFIKEIQKVRSFKINVLKSLNPQIVVLHNARTIFLARGISRSLPFSKIIYDAHELESETNGKVGKPIKKAVTRLIEAISIPKVHRMWVVSDNIRAWYEKRYPKTDIRTVFNFPEIEVNNQDIIRRKVQLLDSGKINFVYQGKLTPARFIDKIVGQFEKMPLNCELHIYGFGPLEEFVRVKAQEYDNITYHGKVLPHELNAAMEKCHIGFSLLKMNCLNHKYAMPNKLFSYLNAGIYTLSIQGSDQAELLEKLGMGIGISEHMEDLISVSLRLNEIRQHFEKILKSPVSFTWSLNKENLEL